MVQTSDAPSVEHVDAPTEHLSTPAGEVRAPSESCCLLVYLVCKTLMHPEILGKSLI
jgi:hypothetical protein